MHEFSVPSIEDYEKIQVVGTLTFELDTSDFDLHLIHDGEVIASSGGLPGSDEQVSRDLAPGDYAFQVVAYAAAGDTYTLTVEFDLPPEPLLL